VILVAGGIAGEVGAGLMIESKNTELRAIDIKLRSANSELRSKSDALLGLVRGEANDARERAARFEKEAAKLRGQNLANERALVELKAKYAWRTISPAQAKILCDKLQTVRGRTATVEWTFTDPEQDTFGSQLVEVLSSKKCGLSVHPTAFGSFIPNSAHALDPIALGYVPAKADLADVVAKALVAASLAKAPVPTVPPIGFGATELEIVIGPRRPN
jgi:hypothetical protein